MKINVKLLTSFLVGSMMFNVILLISYAPVHNVNISLNSLTQDSIPPANSLEQEFIVGSPRTLNDNAVNSMTMCHRTLESRGDIPKYLTDLGLTGQAVEIGVRRGHYSQYILHNWPGHLHLVDPWIRQEEKKSAGGEVVYNDISNAPQGEHEDNLKHVISMLDEFAPGRYTVHRDFSVQAASDFEDNTLDFVYVDARHDYAGALEDMVAWWPKLKDGGLMAGHDFIPDQIKPVEGDFGVQKAVLEFTKSKKREVQSISTKEGHGGRQEPQSVDGGWTTFYFFK